MATVKKFDFEYVDGTQTLAESLGMLLKPYVDLLDDGLNSNAYQELGKTIRSLASSLAEASFSNIEDDEELPELEDDDEF